MEKLENWGCRGCLYTERCEESNQWQQSLRWCHDQLLEYEGQQLNICTAWSCRVAGLYVYTPTSRDDCNAGLRLVAFAHPRGVLFHCHLSLFRVVFLFFCDLVDCCLCHVHELCLCTGPCSRQVQHI